MPITLILRSTLVLVCTQSVPLISQVTVCMFLFTFHLSYNSFKYISGLFDVKAYISQIKYLHGLSCYSNVFLFVAIKSTVDIYVLLQSNILHGLAVKTFSHNLN